MTKETFTFQAEVGKLLDIVARSLYSQREVFLRELISNASDACDKRRYAAVTDAAAGPGEAGFFIDVAADEKARTVRISDNGIGMDKDDLIETLGTIARSGTQAFVQALEAEKAAEAEAGGGKKKKKASSESSLIGQFGVGFYSAFMVADSVEVVTRKVHSDTAWRWESDGKGGFTVEEADRAEPGTDVVVHLSKDAKEFAETRVLKGVVKRYSDHIGHPIRLFAGDADPETLNQGSALWSRPAKDVSDDQYREFYHHVAHAFDEPWMTLHNAVEGVVSYTNLLFVPSQRPFDLFHPDRKVNVKLYVNRVFVTDDCEGLLPGYLRFVRGIVDSPDLNLNISREMLQHDPKLAKIRSGLVKRVIGQLKKKAEKDADAYAAFWETFGAVLKEGLYEDSENRDKLLDIVRFKTTKTGDGDTGALASADDVVGRMKPGQDAVYYISGDDAGQLAKSPHLEGFRAKGVEVLILTDPVDEFWVGNMGEMKGKALKSVTRGGADLDAIESDESEDGKTDDKKPDAPGLDALIASMKQTLGAEVKDVRASARLRESAVCLVADETDMDIHLERLLREHNQLQGGPASVRILEINPAHPMVAGLARRASADGAGSDEVLADAAHLLLDQARILQGEPLPDAAAFSERFSKVMERGVA